MQVVEKLPVLVIDGAPSVIAYRDGAFFLRLALEGSAVAGKKLSPIEARVVSEAEAASQRFEDYRCVILADVPRVEERLADRLKDYVKAGGGLLIFCGEKVDAAAYNATLGTPDVAGGGVLLPAPLGRGSDRVRTRSIPSSRSSAPTRATRSSATSARRPTWAPRASGVSSRPRSRRTAAPR